MNRFRQLNQKVLSTLRLIPNDTCEQLNDEGEVIKPTVNVPINFDLLHKLHTDRTSYLGWLSNDLFGYYLINRYLQQMSSIRYHMVKVGADSLVHQDQGDDNTNLYYHHQGVIISLRTDRHVLIVQQYDLRKGRLTSSHHIDFPRVPKAMVYVPGIGVLFGAGSWLYQLVPDARGTSLIIYRCPLAGLSEISKMAMINDRELIIADRLTGLIHRVAIDCERMTYTSVANISYDLAWGVISSLDVDRLGHIVIVFSLAKILTCRWLDLTTDLWESFKLSFSPKYSNRVQTVIDGDNQLHILMTNFDGQEAVVVDYQLRLYKRYRVKYFTYLVRATDKNVIGVHRSGQIRGAPFDPPIERFIKID